MKTEFKIALRYILTGKKEKFISIISIISVVGIAIGITALIVVLSVMSGFDIEIRDKIVGSFAHITVESHEGIEDYESLIKKINASQNVIASSPYIQGEVLLSAYGSVFPLSIRGVDVEGEKKVTKIDKYIIKGDLNSLEDSGCVIGKELAYNLGVGIGDEISVYSMFSKEPVSLKIAAIFNSGVYDYDIGLIFVNIKTSQSLFGMTGRVAGISVALDNIYKAEEIKMSLAKELDYMYKVKSWVDKNRNFFAALKLEKIGMFIALVLIVLVACFNIISTLIVMVVQKTKDISIFRIIGLSKKRIRLVFTFVGLLIGLTGTFLGVSGGIFLCLVLKKYQFIKLPSDIYYVQTLPVHLKLWPDIIAVIAASLIIVFISTIYPANKASRIIPAEALRYE